jgi:hypothetical protein
MQKCFAGFQIARKEFATAVQEPVSAPLILTELWRRFHKVVGVSAEFACILTDKSDVSQVTSV